MRYCFSCRHITSDSPQFCNYCGKSYDVKLCPRLHVNPRHADVCSQCGSRDLSLPQRHVSLFGKALFLLASLLPGFALLILSVIYLGYFVLKLLTDPAGLLPLMLLGLVLGLLWLAWISLPVSVSRFLQDRRRLK